MKFKTLSLVFSLFLFSSSLPAATFQVGMPSKQVDLQENTKSNKSFRVIGKIIVSATQVEELSKKMRKIAGKKNADLVLAYKVLRHGTTPGIMGRGIKLDQGKPQGDALFLSEQKSAVAEGVLVQYVKEGGITEITDQTAIPILDLN